MNFKKLNTEDWWATFAGLAIFALISFSASFPIPKDLNQAPSWETYPIEIHGHKYYWLIALPALLAFLISTIVATYCINTTKKDTEKKHVHVGGLLFIFALATISIVVGNQEDMKANGVGSSLWSLCLGIFCSNCIFRVYHVCTTKEYHLLSIQGIQEPTTSKWSEPCLPYWLKDCTQDEFFIKISLVLLAVDLMTAKDTIVQSIMISWIDTPLLVLIIYLIGSKILKIESDYSLITASAVSVCGSSAANAVGTTIGATKSAVGYPIAIMSLFTVPMIPLMPLFYNEVLKAHFLWHDEQGGAWIGGTVDSTGAVVASASIISLEAKETAAIVKMLQNCLIGPICLVIILCKRYAQRGKGQSKENILQMLWDRFPKFVLGFFLVCLCLTFAPRSDWKERSIPTCQALSGWFETVGFVAIGLNIHVGEMISKLGVLKLIPLYIIGQLIDCVSTGVAAYYCLSRRHHA